MTGAGAALAPITAVGATDGSTRLVGAVNADSGLASAAADDATSGRFATSGRRWFTTVSQTCSCRQI